VREQSSCRQTRSWRIVGTNVRSNNIVVVGFAFPVTGIGSVARPVSSWQLLLPFVHRFGPVPFVLAFRVLPCSFAVCCASPSSFLFLVGALEQPQQREGIPKTTAKQDHADPRCLVVFQLHWNSRSGCETVKLLIVRNWFKYPQCPEMPWDCSS